MNDDKKTPLGAMNAGDELQRQLRAHMPIDMQLRAAGMIDADGAPVAKSLDPNVSGIAHETECPCKYCIRARNRAEFQVLLAELKNQPKE